jgi:hypothetical protein
VFYPPYKQGKNKLKTLTHIFKFKRQKQEQKQGKSGFE